MPQKTLRSRLTDSSLLRHALQWLVILFIISVCIAAVVYVRDYRPLNEAGIRQALESGDFSKISSIERSSFWPCQARGREPVRFSFYIRGNYEGKHYERLTICINKNGEYTVKVPIITPDGVIITDEYFLQ